VSGALEGRVAVVTGAGSGIGRAIAERYHREGASVVVADVSGNESAVAKALGAPAVAVHADVSRSADVQNMLKTAVDRFGGLDILCNVAGVDGELGPVADCSEENFERIVAVNLRGVFLGIKYAIPLLLARGGGSIISVSSAAGLVGMPGMCVYGASKAGVIQLTRGAAVEYARANLRINAICPGVVDTPMIRKLAERYPDALERGNAATPMGRAAQPDEIAGAAVYLASKEASFVTGVALPVDGGYVAP
jgi:NAD(P)-dependent dehydrogenase (short-subunit alcohol dehydrogenase family)